MTAIGHLAIERERHTVDPPSACPSCQSGLTDLTDLLFIYFYIIIYV